MIKQTKDSQEDIRQLCEEAKAASAVLGTLPAEKKNELLARCAVSLREHGEEILSANRLDCDQAEDNGMSEGLLDRLTLNEKRVEAMARGLEDVAKLPDPVGEELRSFTRPNGLLIRKLRVPMGVIGIIYEARPNVTADAFALCFKAGSACVLKGGSAALGTNRAVVAALREALFSCGLPANSVSLIEATDRESTLLLMRMKGLVDLLIPRGSAALIRSVTENATVPVIETGSGNCHVFIDETADIDMAIRIVLNAKTQRVGVCNACESLLVHEAIAPAVIPPLCTALTEHQVQIFADDAARMIYPKLSKASEEDWEKEYLDYKISLKIVPDVAAAIAHINRYNTKHSETIVTENPENARLFQKEVDAACVYWNASTRFTDGGEFGFGGEIGISTQKLHARGPMGLAEITSYKYVIDGNGQIR